MTRESAREWTRSLADKYLPGESDGYQTFLKLVSDACLPGSVVADIGCGGEEFLTYLMQKAGRIIGVDNRELRGNYHSYVKADVEKELPLEAGSLDLAASKFLLEHIRDPAAFLRRIHEALRSGGKVVLMTPNILYYPYTANYILSRFVPQRARMKLVAVFSGRGEDEIFPVAYACNTPSTLRRMLEEAGFEVLFLDTYTDFLVGSVNRPLGAIAVAYEKLVNLAGIKGLKGFIVAQGRKP
jgi:SAM-dependent methyltransferase